MVNNTSPCASEKSYTYNARGQQIGYSDGETAASYAYNPSGLRNAKTVGGSTKYFVYNSMQIVFEYEDSISDGTVYYYGLNRTHNSNGEIYVYNAHGDTVQLVKDNAVVVTYTYDAFGNLTSQIGESDNPFKYCSEYFDEETSTYYLRARYYNPANGRFTQQDSWAFMDASDPLSLNLYTYCGNNPVMYVDPSGHAWYHWALGAVVVVACAAAVVATAGGAAAGIAAVAAVANGTAAATAASTVAAGAFIGSVTVYGSAALCAAGNSSLESPEAFADDFAAQGNWGTVAGTAVGGLFGSAYGYALYCDATQQANPPSNNSSSQTTQENKGDSSGYNGADVPMGSRRNQMNQPKNPSYQPVRNSATTISGREYSGHALDRMQDRGILPSVVENTISTGVEMAARNGVVQYYDSINQVSVFLNSAGKVVTVTYGK